MKDNKIPCLEDSFINNSKNNLIKSINTDLDIIYIKDISKIKSMVDIRAYNQHIDNIITKLDLLKIKVVDNQDFNIDLHIPFID